MRGNQFTINTNQPIEKITHSVVTLKLHDDIRKAMKSSEVTIAIFTDYSKAFDTIDFSILIKKMHILNFSKLFLYWIFNYLAERHFVQIDSSISNILIIDFRVPQGSLLSPILFNICVADMTNILSEGQCIQYADDSTICKSSEAKEVTKCSIELENELKLLKQL